MKLRTELSLALAAIVVGLFVTCISGCASLADKDIDSSFRKTYVYETYLKDDAIHVESKEGVVTLTGTTTDAFSKLLAEVTMSSVDGVIRVDNQLVTKAEAVSELADTRIGRQVKTTLLFHRNVSASGTQVEVKDGIVTLKGEASSQAQKELTAEYAKDIVGVLSIKNEMTVRAGTEPAERTAGEKMDDASVAALVKTVLLTHASTSSVRTQVVVRNGEVMMTGIARNAEEKALVTKLVNDIQGVTSVKNEMTVKEIVTK